MRFGSPSSGGRGEVPAVIPLAGLWRTGRCSPAITRGGNSPMAVSCQKMLTEPELADNSTVLAEGLKFPAGIELIDGSISVGQGTELVFLQETFGDG